VAKFSLTIADWDVERVLSALSIAGGYPDVSDVNAKAFILDYIRTTVANVEAAAARHVGASSVAPCGFVVTVPTVKETHVIHVR